MKTKIASSALALLIVTPAFLVAQTYTWDGGGSDANFLSPGNWNPDGAPASANDTLIVFSGAANTLPVLNSTFTFKDLSFNSTTSFGLSGTGTLSVFGNGASGVSGNNQGITNNGAGAQTITNPIQLTGNAQFYAIGGKLTLGGTVDTNGKSILLRSFGNSARLVLNGAISGTPSAFVIRGANGNGVVEFNGENIFTQTVQVWEGTALASNNAAFGSTANEVRLGLASLANNTAILTGGAFTVAQNMRLISKSGAGTYTIGGNTADASTYSGNIIMHSSGTAGTQTAMGLQVSAVADGRVNFTGNILRQAAALGSGDSLAKTGDGTVALHGTGNNYSGTTAVNAGTLLVNGVLASGGAAVTVGSGATLGGLGTINRNVQFASGAVLAPGDGGAGAFAIGGLLTLDTASLLRFDIGDTVGLTGNQALAGVLSIVSTDGYTGDGTYTLFSVSGGVITDAGLTLATPTLGDYTFALDFSQPDKVLLNVSSSIPEPATASILSAGLVLGAVVASRRRR